MSVIGYHIYNLTYIQLTANVNNKHADIPAIVLECLISNEI